MQKKLLFAALLFWFSFISAQDYSSFYLHRNTRFSYFSMEACNTSNPESLKNFLEVQFSCSLILSHTSVNKYSRIYFFSQVKNNIEVYHGFANVILDKNANSFQVNSDIFFGIPEKIISYAGACWFYNMDQWVLATKKVNYESREGTLLEIITDEKGIVISQQDLALRGQPKDTSIRVKVFNPDPLTSAHKTYGAPYADFNDSDVAVLNSERVWKKVQCSFLNDTFWLSNKYLTPFKYDLNNSYNPVFRVKDTLFDYTRHQHEFEDVMVLYHITTFQDYINGLGFDTLGYRPTAYDAHGLKGDNSTYFPNVGIVYGTGGIDDAEDAEVIIHEYTHSLREYASPGTNNGFERIATEEAFCDYISSSYKMGIDSFGWKKWAYWDGNNPAENWNGRNIASLKVYPQALTGNLYQNSEIFSSALMRIYLKLGKGITDRLALQTLFYLSNNLTMPQTALLFIKADSTLYNGIHSDTIWNTFAETHILPWKTGIKNVTRNKYEIKIINSLNFMQGKGDLSVQLPYEERGTYALTNSLSQEIAKENFNTNYFEIINGIIKSPGIYYLTITTPTYSVTEKLIVQ